MIDRCTRRAFLGRSAGLAAVAAAAPWFGDGQASTVAHAHNVSGNAARAGELYNAMQKYFWLPDAKLYLETSPRKNSNPYAYLWPFYEALSGTVDLLGIGAIGRTALDDCLAGLLKYYRGPSSGYDSYVRPPGGDRYYDDNAWVGRTLVQLHRMNTPVSTAAFATALGGAQDVFAFLETGWATDRNGGVYWVKDRSWNFDRGTGPTGGFAKLGLHLYELTGSSAYLSRATQAYDWVTNTLLTKTGQYAGALYWDKVLADNSIDTRYWSYNQGVMIGASVLLSRITSDPAKKQQYLGQAIKTADAAIAYYNSVGWYSQPVIFNALFFRNLLLLYAVTKNASYRDAMQRFADGVWNSSRIHNQKSHLIKFEERTSAHKLREQAGMVQIYACLAWVDADKELAVLC